MRGKIYSADGCEEKTKIWCIRARGKVGRDHGDVGGMRYSADGCERKGVFTVQLVEGEIEHSFRAGCV